MMFSGHYWGVQLVDSLTSLLGLAQGLCATIAPNEMKGKIQRL